MQLAKRNGWYGCGVKAASALLLIRIFSRHLYLIRLPDEHAVELVEKQIARQREREQRENEGYGQA